MEFDPDAIEDHTLPGYERIHSVRVSSPQHVVLHYEPIYSVFQKVGDAMNAWAKQLNDEDAAQIVGKPSRKRAVGAVDVSCLHPSLTRFTPEHCSLLYV